MIEKAVKESIAFLGLKAKLIEVKLVGSHWQWEVENEGGHKMIGAVQNHDGEPSYVVAKCRSEIVSAMALAMHPMGDAISTLLSAMSNNMIDDQSRNVPAELILRAIIKEMIYKYSVPKGKAFEFICGELLHIKQNIEELYAEARKRVAVEKKYQGPSIRTMLKGK